MNLKQLTWDNHKKAERKQFASILMSGKIAPELYYKYLTNQYYMYVMLEESLRICGLSPEYWDVFRADRMRTDLQELERVYEFVYDPVNLCGVTAQYVTHVENLQKNQDLNGLIAHMYVRHFGDMYGGAMIAKKVPGSGMMYYFEEKEELKEKLRSLLNDDMADEANRCFEFAIRLFEELVNE
jgi:heme oxygenase